MAHEEPPAVRVRSTRLDPGCPVALRDTLGVYDLAIDFDQPVEDIVGALAAVFREAVETGRWARHRTSGTGPTPTAT